MGLTVNALLKKLTSEEIAEYMAFDQLKNEKYTERLKSEMMTEEERNMQLKKILGFK